MRKIILASLASWGLIFSLGANTALADINHESPTTQFRPMEQPLSTKAAVTFAGMTLIGLEIWWFLLSKPKP
ncbi:hypothetical protein [Anabaena subtropica]|uniref:Uncharacterized protein n=1 Tax=Anabaena subtropica FACHB-260 TaxID=2692884 RepID=A0ABR8CPM1_9NOST|nr:hypothetical protein [Anabaena subtropica]MBD2345142.1 hypothetical protein [Anabaena subtropica FACHB-260]